MTTREALMKGGDDGAALTVGKPEESPLISSLAADADPHMPPKKQLTAAQIELLRRWVKEGAPWDAAALKDRPSAPRTVALATASGGVSPGARACAFARCKAPRRQLRKRSRALRCDGKGTIRRRPCERAPRSGAVARLESGRQIDRDRCVSADHFVEWRIARTGTRDHRRADRPDRRAAVPARWKAARRGGWPRLGGGNGPHHRHRDRRAGRVVGRAR